MDNNNKLWNDSQNFQPKSTNVFAITGLVLGIISWFLNLFGIIGTLAIVFSSIALSQIKTNNEKGKGFAITGLVSGIINVIYAVVMLTTLL